MNIILVGNSANILAVKVGNLIDDFDVVVRFNNYETAGFEQFVGQKTDIIARRACDDVRLHPTSGGKPHILAFVSYGRWWKGMQNVGNQLRSHYGSACEIVNVVDCKITGEKIGLDQPIPECASIGVLAIDYFLTKNSQIYIHGFGGNSEEHYFKKPPRDQNFHNFEKEAIWIKKLEEEGKIVRLSV